jgi:acyl-CoA synthetase (NDP forming)
VISAGFAEVSGDGRDVEARLARIVRGAGMRMIGPNCMGVLNTDPAFSMNATFAPSWPPSGGVSMLSQSGALGLAMLDRAVELHMGIADFVSVGNKADVSANDLLSYWADDPKTRVIALYLESFGNPRKFARIAPDVARKKPIVAVKSGRSAAGTRAAASHSAALASIDVGVDALFAQAGVIRTNTLEELFDVVSLLSTQPLPGGRRVGVVTNAGGPGILFADACEAHGLTLPELAQETQDVLRSFLPITASVKNPVDMIASATPEQFARAIEAVGADPSCRLTRRHLHPAAGHEARRGRRGRRACSRHRTVGQARSGCIHGLPRYADHAGGRPSGQHPIVFVSGERGPRALGGGSLRRVAQAAEGDRARAGARGCARRPPHGRARAYGRDLAVVGLGAGRSGDPEPRRRPPGAVRAGCTRRGACRAGRGTTGLPGRGQGVAPGLLHKSDVGGVALGLEDATAVRTAVETMASNVSQAGHALEGFLVQKQIDGGVEALVGITLDPSLGPVLIAGLGGVQVELLRDVSFRITPVSDIDAGEMIASLRGARLLAGFRGSPAVDREALLDVIQRLSALVEAFPELVELEINPLKVLPRGAVAVDARMRLAPASGARGQ